jgi:acyl carrier protein|tara:strand:- start:6827 stop:7069 length:243 start_codon:yes stop_codon:yes gene_type:complete
MSAVEKYSKIFKDALNISDNKFNENIKYNEIEEWDSIAHMTLVAALEEEYKVTLETDDIIDFSSFKKGLEILKKYKIDIS